MTHVELLLPGGGRMTASLPLNEHMQKQVNSGQLQYAEPEPAPQPAGLDGEGGEGGVERVSAPPTTPAVPPVAVEEPVAPESPGQPVDGASEMPAPAGNASREEWAAFAVAQGMHPDEAGQLKRDEIKARIVPGDDTPEA
ncbi:MAG TPA: hypothetical protein VHX38_18745 [Pseudonocardiaceae bacterium]|jgi:hypothetical protein|nr:hypothetical protein [Pseudonocardiaceae bacterium]